MSVESNKPNMEVFDYLSVIIRHKYWFLGIALTVFVSGCVAIYLLPSVYVVQSEILIEHEAMYSANEGGNNDRNLNHRVHAIIKTVMTNENIEKILKKYDLARDNISEFDLFNLIREFRENTSFEFENVEVIHPTTGKQGMVSVGLKIQYENQTAALAFNITNELTDLLLNATSGKVAGEEERRFAFLKNRMEVILEEVKETGEKVANFKDKNALFLPEIYPIAIERYNSLEAKLLESEDRLKLLKKREDELSADIATTSKDAIIYSPDGRRIVGPEENLLMLEAEYVEKASKYSASHPEVLSLKREINALRRHVKTFDSAAIEIELKAAREDLANAMEKYTAAHPDIKELETKVSEFERTLQETRSKGEPKSTSQPNNPAYMRLLTRLESVREEIVQEEDSKQHLSKMLGEVQNQIQQIPLIAQQLEELDRNRQRALVKYSVIEKQLVQTELNKNMNDASLFDRFVLIETPTYPTLPSKPNKKVMLAALFILTVFLAYFFVLLKDWLSDKILNSYDLEQYVDMPVYVVPKFR